MKKRILSLAFAVLMLFSLIPLTAVTASAGYGYVAASVTGDKIMWAAYYGAEYYEIVCSGPGITNEVLLSNITGTSSTFTKKLPDLFLSKPSGSYSLSVAAYNKSKKMIAYSNTLAYYYTSPYMQLPVPNAHWDGMKVVFDSFDFTPYQKQGYTKGYIWAAVHLYEDGVKLGYRAQSLLDGNTFNLSGLITKENSVYRFELQFIRAGGTPIVPSEVFKSEEATGKQLMNGYATEQWIYDDALLTIGENEQVKFLFDVGPTEIWSAKLVSSASEMPDGMSLSFGSLNVFISGKPTKVGKFNPEFKITMRNGHIIHYVMRVMVQSDKVIKSGELITLPKGKKANVSLKIDKPAVYHSVSKVSGSLPEGMEWTWSEANDPVIYGTPTKTGDSSASFQMVFATGERRKHSVRTLVYDPSAPIESVTVDMSNGGSVVMNWDTYASTTQKALSAAVMKGQINETTAGTRYSKYDLDYDGSWDVAWTSENGVITYTALAGRNLQGSYTLKLNSDALGYLDSYTTEYAKEIVFVFPPMVLESYTIDLTEGECVISTEDYIYSLMLSLNAADNADQIGIGSDSRGTLLDVDYNGSWDVLVWVEWSGDAVGTHFKLLPENSLKMQDFDLKLSDAALATFSEGYYTKSILFRTRPKNPFTDVPEGKWYTDSVLWCYLNGYMTGTSDSTFAPSSPFTRAMFVTVLAKIAGADTSAYTGSSFKDVPADKWYSKPIQWAYKEGFAAGLGGGKFGPNDKVTREQLAQFLFNYTRKIGRSTAGSDGISDTFPDVDKISGWALEAYEWAVYFGLISGVKQGETVYLMPQGSATRAQVAVIVRNYIEMLDAYE